MQTQYSQRLNQRLVVLFFSNEKYNTQRFKKIMFSATQIPYTQEVNQDLVFQQHKKTIRWDSMIVTFSVTQRQ